MRSRSDQDAALVTPSSAPQPARERLLWMVRERPGMTLGELHRRLNVGWGQLYHHLGQLERFGLVRFKVDGRCRRVHPCHPPEAHQACSALVVLRTESARRIAHAIVEQPGHSGGEIEASLGISYRVLRYHVQRLLKAGLLEREGCHGYRSLTASPRLRDLLRSLGGSS